MDEWISVEDKLPEDFTPVLVYMPDMAPFPQVREGYSVEGRFMVPALMEEYPVSHWRAMPEPPKASLQDDTLCPQALQQDYQPAGGCASVPCSACRKEFWEQEVE